MGHGKGLPESVNAYLRDQIEAWIVGAEGRTAAELARLLGVSPAHVSNLRKHGRGAGYSTEEGMARILGVSVDELRRRADESWSKNRPVELHREDRYPNRRAAVEFMRGLVHPEAVRRVEAISNEDAGDPDRKWWADRLELEDRKVRRELADPSRHAEEEEHARAAGDDLEASTRPRRRRS